MPRENDPETASTGKQSPEITIEGSQSPETMIGSSQSPETMIESSQSPETTIESSQSPEPMSEVDPYSEITESSLEASTQEIEDAGDSIASENLSEETVCSICGGTKLNNDKGQKTLLHTLLICKCDPKLGETPEEVNKSDLECLDNDAGVSEARKTVKTGAASLPVPEEDFSGDSIEDLSGSASSASNDAHLESLSSVAGVSGTGQAERTRSKSLVVPGGSSIQKPPEQELSGESVEDTSASDSGISDPGFEQYIYMTTVKPPPRSFVEAQRRVAEGVQLPERPQDEPAAAVEVVQIEDASGEDRPPSEPRVVLHESNSPAPDLVNNPDARAQASIDLDKTIYRGIACILCLVFIVVAILLLTAQLTFNSSLQSNNNNSNSTKDLDKNSTNGH